MTGKTGEELTQPWEHNRDLDGPVRIQLQYAVENLGAVGGFNICLIYYIWFHCVSDTIFIYLNKIY